MPADRELLVLRHAKSSWSSGSGRDFDRPLAERGRVDAPRMGRWLVDQGLVPELIVSSTARRAAETARAVAAELALDPDAIRFDDRIYEARRGALLAVLGDVPPETRRVLLVGHNPGLEDLVRTLARDTHAHDDGHKFFPTAALARLAIEAPWHGLGEGHAELLDLVRPKSIPGGA